MDYFTIYDYSLVVSLVLMLFFAFYFLFAKTLDKPIFVNYLRSRRIMGVAILVLCANYMVHLFIKPRFYYEEAAILMNLSTYFLTYWLFYSGFMILLNRFKINLRRMTRNLVIWLVYTLISATLIYGFPACSFQHICLLIMAAILMVYGIYLSIDVIRTYRWAVRLFDESHSDNISAYIRWMSIFTWWALCYGVCCGLLTFLPEHWVFLWILSSIPFYIYLYCSYMNYLLFYEHVEAILETINPELAEHLVEPDEIDVPAPTPSFHATIEKRLSEWISDCGFTKHGLTIEDLSVALSTNRTYLSSYIKTTYKLSFREWIAELRIEYAKDKLMNQPELTIASISENSGFLSLSYFTKIFTQKTGYSPSKWRKNHETEQ